MAIGLRWVGTIKRMSNIEAFWNSLGTFTVLHSLKKVKTRA